MDYRKATRLRLALADDHTIMRSGLRLLLERESDFSMVGEAGDGREVIEIVEAQSPDIVIMDVAMPNLNGIEAARRITSSHPRTAIIILSMHSDESYVLRALNAGARWISVKRLRGKRSYLRGARRERRQGVLLPGYQQTAGGGLRSPASPAGSRG